MRNEDELVYFNMLEINLHNSYVTLMVSPELSIVTIVCMYYHYKHEPLFSPFIVYCSPFSL